jgi:putative addiction module component (TIGR02574 family)
MLGTLEEILSAALELPLETRARLAEHLLLSLDGPNQKEIDDAWAEEAERRMREIDEGKVTPTPGNQVIDRLRSRRLRK